MVQSRIPGDAGRVLLPLARAALAERLRLPAPEVPEAQWLGQQGASFVSLHLAGRLRGCVGTLDAYRGLGVDVADNARAAGFADRRFRPLTVEEYAGVCVEVSVLSSPQPIAYADRGELLSELRPGVDGVLLEAGSRRGTFLPQVWELLPEPERFLEQLVVKAGFAREAWDPRWRFSRYGVTAWSELDPPRHAGRRREEAE